MSELLPGTMDRKMSQLSEFFFLSTSVVRA